MMLQDFRYNFEVGDVDLSNDGTQVVECETQSELDMQNLLILLEARPTNILTPTFGFGGVEQLSNSTNEEIEAIKADFEEMAKNDGCVDPVLEIVAVGEETTIKLLGTYAA